MFQNVEGYIGKSIAIRVRTNKYDPKLPVPFEAHLRPPVGERNLPLHAVDRIRGVALVGAESQYVFEVIGESSLCEGVIIYFNVSD